MATIMATVLTITDAEILTLARLNLLIGDDATLAASDVSAVKGYEQEAQEQRIEAGFLATVSLRPLFRRAVAKIIAAEVLEMRARDGSDEGFIGAGVTVAGPSAATDYSRRLREDAERELGPYLILPPDAGADPSAVALREAQAAKVVAETATHPAESAAEVAKTDNEAAKILAEIGKVGSDADKAKSDAVLAQLKAGVITADEARMLLGLIGTAPLASAITPQALDSRRRSVVNLIDRGLLHGDEAGLTAYLGLPFGVSLARSVVSPIITPSEPSGAAQAAQRRLFGRSEAARFNKGGTDDWE